MALLTGNLADFQGALDRSTNPRIVLTPNGAAVSANRVLYAKPIIIDTFGDDNGWTKDVLPTTDLIGIEGDDAWYDVRIERQVSGADWVPWDDTTWRLKVPPEGGKFSGLVIAKTHPAQIYVGPAVTPESSQPAQELDPNRWTGWLKTNTYAGEFNYYEWNGMRWLPKARLEFATDASMAAELSRDDSAASIAVDERVRPVAIEVVAEAPTVVAAAATRVDAELAARDLVQGGDPRILPTDKLIYQGPLPSSTGYLWGIVVVRGGRKYVAAGVKLNGDLVGRTTGSSSSGSSGLALNVVPDCIQEWWVGPVTQRFLGWTATAGLGSGGQVLAIDFNDRSAPTVMQVGTATVDDHNVPARYTIPGRGSILQWTHHGADSLLRFVVAPGTGRADTFVNRPVQTIAAGGAVSYGWLLHIATAQTSTTDTFWDFVRTGLTWSIVEVVVNWSTGTITRPNPPKPIVTFTEQPYLTIAPAVYVDGVLRKVRIAAGYNPAASRDDVFLFELDLSTGDMNDKRNPSVVWNVNSGTALQASALTAVLPDKNPGTRRLLGVSGIGGGEAWKILTVEYAGAVGADGVYREHTFNVTTMAVTTRDLGTTGKHLERYPAGAAFAEDGSVWTIRESNNTYTLANEGVAVRRSTNPMFRAMAVPPGGPIDVLVAEVAGNYTDYLNWSGVNLIGVKKVALA
ncbi:hypothetical protein [Microbacterium sp. BH-3-3-3]|uniref:hypothetical protein n=1 Tax=Microbacterium sp. BH-3-3-3 TaxID=1906742 RepID=UPI0011A6131F|nr:hypothetical protein [Microbacterium sp. BH-3-3-3]